MAKRPSDQAPADEWNASEDGVAELDDGFLIDPAMQGVTTTGEVLAELRRRALARSRKKDAAPTDVQQSELSKRRRSTLDFFLNQRAKELDAQEKALSAREVELGAARDDLRAEGLEALVEFLSLMSGGAETPEAREVIAEHAPLLERLGVSVEELLRRVRARR